MKTSPKLFTCLLASLSLLLLTACFSKETKLETRQPDDQVFLDQAKATVEVTPRQPVYLYGEGNQAAKAEKITLHINNEPLLLDKSYVRLVGVVSGGRRPVALVDVGGRGIVLSQGEELCGYQVLLVETDRLELKREGQ